MKISDKLPLLLALPIGAVAVYFIGANVTDNSLLAVKAARNWLLISLVVYIVNYAVAWSFKYSFGATMIRMLVSSIFAYVSISEIVDLGGENFDNLSQIMGGVGNLQPEIISLVRFVLVSYVLSLVMMITAIAVGFESTDETT